MIRNPILAGFNADPSILRVGGDYYIATSTFAWFPGVTIYHSKDLKNWRIAARPLESQQQLDLRGVASSCGVWAPCLRYDSSLSMFFLLYSLVRGNASRFFDLRNCLVTSPSIEGPWSDPVVLSSSGFDPSIFFDGDGRAYVANLEWDFRKGYEHPGWIVLQEYSRDERRLIGEPRRISRGATDLGCLEGPNIYARAGLYYLLTAEGGTGFGHAVSVARSRSVWGPYEPDPGNPVLSSISALFYGRGDPDFLKPDRFNPAAEMQKAGHASLVETPEGEWYMAHLGARPLLPSRACVLGRETFLQRCRWTDDGWLRLDDPEGRPRMRVPEPSGAPDHPFPFPPDRDEFDDERLPPVYYSLRVPMEESWVSLRERKGWLRITGRESPHSLHEQSVVARRIEHFNWEAETLLDFSPRAFQQMAGLLVMQGVETWYYLRMYWSESLRSPCLGIMISDRMSLDELLDHRVAVPAGSVRLRATVHGAQLRFSFALADAGWREIGPSLDQTRISDEYNRSFAGAFVGMCCQDLGGTGRPAYFDYFRYAPIPS